MDFSRVGWGVGQRDQSTASYWGLATPWQRHQPTSLPPFFSWLCVFTPGSFSGFRNTYGPGPQGPQPACSLGLWAFDCFMAGVCLAQGAACFGGISVVEIFEEVVEGTSVIFIFYFLT